MARAAAGPPPGRLHAVLLYYTAANSSLLAINKLAIGTLHAPAFILFTQLGFAAVAVLAAMAVGVVPRERVRWRQLLLFVPLVLGFLGTLYANIKVLQHSTVETFICFRSSAPLVLSIMDWAFLGRALPRTRSVLCLAGMLAACVGYALDDSRLSLQAYGWMAAWYAISTFDALWFKRVCDSVSVGQWTRVRITNGLAALVLAAALPWARGEHVVLRAVPWDGRQTGVLLLSCLVGLCLSHATFQLRSSVSATTASVVGVVCKLLTVLYSMVIWGRQVSGMGMACLAVSIACGGLYQQAPLRQQPPAPQLDGKRGASLTKQRQRQQPQQQQPLLGGLRPAAGKEGVHHVSSSAALSRSASMTWRPMDPSGGSNLMAVVSLDDEAEEGRIDHQQDGPSPVFVTIVGLDKPAGKR